MTLVFAALFGLAFGSFVNAAIERIPRGESLNGHSHCDACNRVLRPWELIPLVSYVALRGHCATCGGAIGPRALLIEAMCGGAFAIAFWMLPGPAAVVGSGVFVAFVIAAGVALERRSVKS